MKQLHGFIVMVVGLLLCFGVYAEEVEKGEKLHASKCQTCHDSSVYTRANRFVKSRAALQNQVARCKKMASADWSAEQIKDVVDYLDKQYYKF